MIDEEDSITLPPITDFEPLRVYSIYVWIFFTILETRDKLRIVDFI